MESKHPPPDQPANSSTASTPVTGLHVNPALVEPFIEAVPARRLGAHGTYIDMCANLPVNDPAKITVPTIIMRGQYDGIVGLDDLLEFLQRLPNADKEFATMPDIRHARHADEPMRTYHILFRSSPGGADLPEKAAKAQ